MQDKYHRARLYALIRQNMKKALPTNNKSRRFTNRQRDTRF